MNFTDVFAQEIKQAKEKTQALLGFSPKGELPSECLDYIYDQGYGHPEMIPEWKSEIAHPKMEYKSPFLGVLKYSPEAIAMRTAELKGYIAYNEGLKQIPKAIEKMWERLICEEEDFDENLLWDEDERFGLPDDDDDTPDWWFERG